MKLSVALCLVGLGMFLTSAEAQSRADVFREAVPVGLRFTITKANSPPGACGCFLLIGGAADAALPLSRRISAAVEVAGNHAGQVPGTTRGLSTITLLAGPRYQRVISNQQSVFVQGLFGAARGFDTTFSTNSNASDTATVFSYALGAAYEVNLTSTISVRAAQVDFVQTNLPNGNDNRQRNVRFSTGIVVHFSTAKLTR